MLGVRERGMLRASSSQVIAMHLTIYPSKTHPGAAAAADASETIRAAVAESGRARIIAATGASQFEFLAALVSLPDVPWQHVEMFHLDEYIGLSADHPASFRRYLRERLIEPTRIGTVHLLDGEQDPRDECARVGALIAAAPVDVAFVGIGENGHLAFNDPPADFDTREPYLVVSLDEACRRQQVGEGWFSELESVPPQRHLDVVPPDSRGTAHPLHRAGRAQGRGRQRPPSKGRYASRACLDPADARRRDAVPRPDSASLLQKP